jgi:hypothetical protein
LDRRNPFQKQLSRQKTAQFSRQIKANSRRPWAAENGSDRLLSNGESGETAISAVDEIQPPGISKLIGPLELAHARW